MTVPPAPRVQPLRDRIAILEDALRRHGIAPPEAAEEAAVSTESERAEEWGTEKVSE